MSKIRLSNERLSALNDSERSLLDLLPEFDEAAECGIECGELRNAATGMLERIRKIKQTYAPSQLPRVE